jgi:uncharacterized Zn-finger protein
MHSCGYCQQTFVKKSQLMEHHRLNKHHNTFTCGVCQERFARKKNLDRHERKHNNDSFLPCSECDCCTDERITRSCSINGLFLVKTCWQYTQECICKRQMYIYNMNQTVQLHVNYSLELHVWLTQTTQWPKDTKEVIRSCKSNKDRQHNGQKIPKRYSEAVNQTRWLPLWYLLAIV